MFKAEGQNSGYVRYKPVVEDAPALSFLHARAWSSGSPKQFNKICDNQEGAGFRGEVE